MADSRADTFKRFLFEFSEAYPGRKFMWVRFLLGDVLTISQLSENTMVLELCQCLTEAGDISNSQIKILSDIGELTKTSHSIGLIKKYREEHQVGGGKVLSEYRKALFQCLRETTSDDFHKIAAYYNLNSHGFNNIWDLVFFLEQQNQLNHSKESIFQFSRLLNERAKLRLTLYLRTSEEERSTDAQGNTYAVTKLPWTSEYKKLEERNYRQLLVDISTWWSDRGDVFMLKVLLSDFEQVFRNDLQSRSNPFDLFDLLKGPGIIRLDNVDVLIQATALASNLHGVDTKIKKHFETFPGFGELQITKFTYHRQNLIKFGKCLTTSQINTIKWLKDIRGVNDNQWQLIFELDININNSYTVEKTKDFIEDLKENDMGNLAEIFSTSV